MADPPVSHDFVYVHTDIPAEMTIREWRAKRAAEHAAQRQQDRAGRAGGLLVAPGFVARKAAAKMSASVGVAAARRYFPRLNMRSFRRTAD